MYKILFMFVSASFSFSTVGFASMETIDSECRIHAKESAITTYKSCVKDTRSQRIEEIRKEYQSKLLELKSYYETEMKKMSLSQKSGAEEKISMERSSEITLKKKSKASIRTNSLPTKKIPGKSLPIRTIDPEVQADASAAGSSSLSTEGGNAEMTIVEDGSI